MAAEVEEIDDADGFLLDVNTDEVEVRTEVDAVVVDAASDVLHSVMV